MSRDGMNYAPDMSHVKPVVEPGEFAFAASHFDHGHIYGQILGLATAGGVLKKIYEPDQARIESVREQHPEAQVVTDFQEILDDDEIKLVTSAAIPNLRCGIGLQIMDSGKDYLTDKAPFTTFEQLASARAKVEETGRKYMVCYSERLSNEAAWHAGEMIRDGVIGDVLQVLNLAPHNLAAETRPEWFFKRECYGGILTDIGSHQFEQFLYYAGAKDAEVTYARIENFRNPEYPELNDFGETCLKLDTGASAYARLDWFNPAASRTWGDGRTFAMGTKGYIEIRKNIDVAHEGANKIYLVNDTEEVEIDCTGKVGFPYYGKLILDILNGAENAMTQEHAFKAAEIALEAQRIAEAAQVS